MWPNPKRHKSGNNDRTALKSKRRTWYIPWSSDPLGAQWVCVLDPEMMAKRNTDQIKSSIPETQADYQCLPLVGGRWLGWKMTTYCPGTQIHQEQLGIQKYTYEWSCKWSRKMECDGRKAAPMMCWRLYLPWKRMMPKYGLLSALCTFGWKASVWTAWMECFQKKRTRTRVGSFWGL